MAARSAQPRPRPLFAQGDGAPFPRARPPVGAGGLNAGRCATILTMRSPIRVTIALVLTFIAAETFAAVSKKYSEWRNGPVQWIMTSDEQKAWRNVKTDEDAVRFIDLFWARRDPTPGTPHNTYRDEFDTRVRLADQNYSERGRKGSMTDRGRTLIILGPPQTGGGSASTAASVGGMGGQGAGRATGATEQWIWEREEALRKFGMPKVLVAFAQDPITSKWTRDVTRPDFVPASKAAIEKSIHSPNLTEVPEWAAQGGLEPKVIMTREVHFPPGQPTVQTQTVVVPDPATPAPAPGAPAPVTPAPAGSFAPRGASRLMLLKDVVSIDTETRTDPYAKLSPVAAFAASDELGWIAQYCTGNDAADEPSLRFTLRMTGKAVGEEIDRTAPPDEMVPDRIKVAPGCYLLRGAIPLEGMNPGDYELEVVIEDPAVYGDMHRLKQSFRIE